jgi:transcriptional regulator
MLVPRMYRPRRAADVVDTVRGNPLALVVTNGPETPFATNAPVIIERLDADPDDPDPLCGATLLGHLNRVNDHWAAIEAGGNVLVTFHGPHAYISPVAYEQRPAAPTWNFVTVHLRGRIEPIPAGERTLDVVTATVRHLEAVAGTAWDMTGSLDYFRRIVPGVGAFRVHVTRVEAMFKLSQEHPAPVRRSIREHLNANGNGLDRELSDAMWAAETAEDEPRPMVVGEPVGSA